MDGEDLGRYTGINANWHHSLDAAAQQTELDYWSNDTRDAEKKNNGKKQGTTTAHKEQTKQGDGM